MTPAELSQLFTPFFRADSSRARSSGGVGLGLVLVRSIAGAHGGDVRVETARGVGTVVRLTFYGRDCGTERSGSEREPRPGDNPELVASLLPNRPTAPRSEPRAGLVSRMIARARASARQ